MKYTIKFRKGEYAGTTRPISKKARGHFRTKSAARKAYIRRFHKVNPLSRKLSNKKLYSLIRIVKIKRK